MKLLAQTAVSLAFAASTMMAPTACLAERTAKVLPVLTVFVDLPTGFVFLKLPGGWKFAGKLNDVDAARLPQGVVTALLEGDDDDTGAGVTTVTQVR